MKSIAHVRRGFTLVELLVVIAIIGVLTSLMLPAVQAAREATRSASCRNNLRQIAVAVLNHEQSLKYLPSSGNNGTITPKGGGPFQQAGLLYQILPYLEEAAGHDADPATAAAQAVPIYYCPTRRAPLTRDDGQGHPLGLNDYAAPLWKDSTAGAGLGGTSPGCWNFWNDATGDLVDHPYYRNTAFVRGGKAGVAFRPGRMAEITDGTSMTLIMAEKFVDPSRYEPVSVPLDPPAGPWPTLSFSDNGYYGGWDWATVRCSMYGPIQDQPYAAIAYWQMFGSAHPEGVNAAFADGSVRTINFTIVNSVFQLLCRKNDQRVIDPASF